MGKDKLFLACRHARKRLEEGYRSLLIRREITNKARATRDRLPIEAFRGFERFTSFEMETKEIYTREDQICFLSR